jgi:hypothetical protein
LWRLRSWLGPRSLGLPPAAELLHARLMIGRSGTCQLVLADDTVWRRHAELFAPATSSTSAAAGYACRRPSAASVAIEPRASGSRAQTVTSESSSSLSTESCPSGTFTSPPPTA